MGKKKAEEIRTRISTSILHKSLKSGLTGLPRLEAWALTQEVPGGGRKEGSPTGASVHRASGLQHDWAAIHLDHS